MKWNLKILLLLMFVFGLGLNASIVAQDEDPVIQFYGKITEVSGKKMAGVTITIKKNGSTVHTATTASNGKYEPYDAEYKSVYSIIISKPGHYISTQV